MELLKLWILEWIYFKVFLETVRNTVELTWLEECDYICLIAIIVSSRNRVMADKPKFYSSTCIESTFQ